MKGRNFTTKLALPVLVVIAVGLFAFAAAGQINAGAGPNTGIYKMTDAHDRVDVSGLPPSNAAQIAGLTDAHQRAGIASLIYGRTDAADRARAAQGYEIVKALGKMSDLNSRHTPEELTALFQR